MFKIIFCTEYKSYVLHFRSNQSQTIIKGFNNQSLSNVDDNDDEPLFGSLVSISPEYPNLETENKHEGPLKDDRCVSLLILVINQTNLYFYQLY